MSTKDYLKPGAIVPVTNQAVKDLVDLAKQQADRISELEKQSEPVAWMGTDFEGNPTKFRLNPFSCSIPLYTTPQTKPLSDEDILQLWVKKNKLNGASDIIDFAREIRGEK